MSRLIPLLQHDPRARAGAKYNISLLELPNDVLRRIMLLTMQIKEPTCDILDDDVHSELFLNASTPSALRNGIGLAFTCKRMFTIFQQALTGVKLVSSWQAEQNTLIAACKIAANNLRAVHVECSAPVTAALKEVVALRPPVRHFVLIGVNISKALMADIIFYVGQSLQKLVISAAPSLDDTVVDLIADCCHSLKHLELGGSRRVSVHSLSRLFQLAGAKIRGIELNSLHHDSLDEHVLYAIADYCHVLTYIRLLKLKWVNDCGLQRLFLLRAHQLTELGLISCRHASARALRVLSMHGASLKKLNFCFEKGESTRSIPPFCPLLSDDESACLNADSSGLSNGEKALVQLSRQCQNLQHLSISDANLSDPAMTSLALACGKSLKVLNLRYCTSLGNTTLFSLASYCSSLTALDISYLPLVDDNGLYQLMESLGETLDQLQMLGCSGLTDRTLQEAIPRFGRRLRTIRLSYCNFSISAVSTLRQALPRLIVFGASSCCVQ